MALDNPPPTFFALAPPAGGRVVVVADAEKPAPAPAPAGTPARPLLVEDSDSDDDGHLVVGPTGTGGNAGSSSSTGGSGGAAALRTSQPGVTVASAGGSDTAASAAAAAAVDPKRRAAIAEIHDILSDLSELRISEALELTNGNVERAIAMLLDPGAAMSAADVAALAGQAAAGPPAPSAASIRDSDFARQLSEQLDDDDRKHRESQRLQEELMTRALLEEERKGRQAALDSKLYACLICFSECLIGDIYTLDECNHRFCFDCIRGHFDTKIKDANTKSIRCPNPACTHVATYDEVRQVVSKDVFEKYETFLLRATLDEDPNCRWCPRPGCNNAMIGSGGLMMICSNPKCKFSFCFNCREEWHADATCEQFQQWKIENNEADSRFARWAEQNTKKCPNCASSIEKNGGCNHMTCRKCSFEFCWLCSKKYSPSHWSEGTCKQFT